MTIRNKIIEMIEEELPTESIISTLYSYYTNGDIFEELAREGETLSENIILHKNEVIPFDFG